MKTISMATKPVSARSRVSVSERILFRALSGMKVGSLLLELPGGRMQVFGRTFKPEYQSHAYTMLEPRAIIRVRHENFFRRCVFYGDIGFAESFIAGEWETDDLPALLRWFLANVAQAPTLSGSKRRAPALNLLRLLNKAAYLVRPNSPRTSRRNIAEHYDLSNDFFATFLDEGMTYSSGLWSEADISLEAAQLAKYERLCEKLRLKEEDEVLEIGCGWGTFAIHAAKTYGCRVVGLTLSEEQYNWAVKKVHEAGLEDRITICLEDYRRHRGRYNKIVSIEMLEAVGHRYLPDFARACDRLLLPEGLMAFQFIVCPDSRYNELRGGVDFIQKHIFPGSLLLSINRLNDLLSKKGGFWIHETQDIGLDYAQTLREWRRRFFDARDRILEQGFDESFIRKWLYYFSYCQAAFAARNISVVQAVYTRPNNPLLMQPQDVEGEAGL